MEHNQVNISPMKCTCGKAWNKECAMVGLFGNSMREFDTSKLTNSPAINMLMIKDPSNYFQNDDTIHKPKN